MEAETGVDASTGQGTPKTPATPELERGKARILPQKAGGTIPVETLTHILSRSFVYVLSLLIGYDLPPRQGLSPHST